MRTRSQAEKTDHEDGDAVKEASRSSSIPVVNQEKPAIDTFTKLRPAADESTGSVPDEEPPVKVLPRLSSQRRSKASSISKSTSGVNKTELPSFKQPAPVSRPAKDERAATPIRKLTDVVPEKRVADGAKKEALPLKYSQLLEMFSKCVPEHLQMAYRVRSNKSQFLTFADAKLAIQKASKKTFSIKHLAKIKHQIPEILHWQYLEGSGKEPASSRLVINIDSQPALDKGEMDDVAIYALFRDRLTRRARQAAMISKENDDLPEAELPDPSLEDLVSSSKALSGCSWSKASSGYRSRSPSSVKPKRKSVSITPAKRYEATPIFLSPKRLTTVTEASREVVAESTSSAFKTPDPPTRVSFLSPCSTNRQSLRESFKRRMLMSPKRVKARERHHAVGNLVETLNDVRSVFQRLKATKRPVNDVLQALESNTRKKYTKESALLHLHLLMEYAPQFVKLDCSEKEKEVLVIDKACNIQSIKEMLQEVADQRPKVEIPEEEVERRLSILDELDL